MRRFEPDPEIGEGTRGHYREYELVRHEPIHRPNAPARPRHIVNVRRDRTLCGRPCRGWLVEEPFSIFWADCQTCRRSYERDERLAAKSDAMG